jgi:hypothetical protein
MSEVQIKIYTLQKFSNIASSFSTCVLRYLIPSYLKVTLCKACTRMMMTLYLTVHRKCNRIYSGFMTSTNFVPYKNSPVFLQSSTPVTKSSHHEATPKISKEGAAIPGEKESLNVEAIPNLQVHKLPPYLIAWM